jgi:HEAT repeat protein
MVVALAQRKEPAATQALGQVLNSSADPHVRFATAQALSGRAAALPTLAGRLNREPDPQVRKELLRSIGLVGNTAALAVLARAAQEQTDQAARQSAIQELSRSFGAQALGTLEQLLSDPDESIRTTTIKATQRVKTDAARALLQRVADTDASAVVRRVAAAALASATSIPVPAQ